MNAAARYFLEKRARQFAGRIFPYLTKSQTVLDIGSGTGDVTNALRIAGKDVTPVDVADFHGPRTVKPVIYNGTTLPFPNRSFDTVLLLMVMHHTADPSVLFVEAARVAKEIVVIETSYTNFVHKIVTVLTDALGNLQPKFYWTSYKSDAEWREFFKKRGFIVVDSKKFVDIQLFIPYLHIAYFLKRM